MVLRFLGHCDLDGHGSNMQLMTSRGYLYVGHSVKEIGTTIVDVSDPRRPRVCGELPGFKNTKSAKVQVAGDLLLVSYEQRGPEEAERTGFTVYDISKPQHPREVAYYHTGGQGIHRMWYTGERYAYISAVPEGFRDRMLMIFDMKDPEHPCVAGQWWLPGLWEAGGETPDFPPGLKCRLHHAVVHGNRAYMGLWDAGLGILDISDVAKPKEISRLTWAPSDGGCTHTALPLPNRNLLVVTDESHQPRCQEVQKRVMVIDISNEHEPKVLSKFPVPDGDFCNKGLRFGPHNLHENRPGSFISENRIFVTYYNAGLRIYDLTDPQAPAEADHYIPPAHPGTEAVQVDDVFVEANGLVYISDRVGGGIYVLELN